MRAAPSSEGSVTGSLRWGQLQCGHFVCGSHACRGAWMRAAALSGTAGRIRTRGACSRGCHVLRESKICACRGLVACCVFFGRCRMAPGSGVILRGRHAPCDNQPIATNVSALSLLRGIAASRTSLGRCGETRPLTGPLGRRCARRQRPDHVSLERRGADVAQTPTAGQTSSGRCDTGVVLNASVRTTSLLRDGAPKLCNDSNQQHRKVRLAACPATATSKRRKRNGAPWGTLPPHSYGAVDNVSRTRVPTKSALQTSRLPARKGGRTPWCRVLAATLQAHPAVCSCQLLLLSTECPQFAVNCNRSTARRGHTQGDGVHRSQGRSATI